MFPFDKMPGSDRGWPSYRMIEWKVTRKILRTVSSSCSVGFCCRRSRMTVASTPVCSKSCRSPTTAARTWKPWRSNISRTLLSHCDRSTWETIWWRTRGLLLELKKQRAVSGESVSRRQINYRLADRAFPTMIPLNRGHIWPRAPIGPRRVNCPIASSM